MKRTLLALGVAVAILSGCGGGGSALNPLTAPTSKPVIVPTVAPVPTAAPAASFGSFILLADSPGTFTMLNFASTIADFSYTASVPSIGNGASCQPLSFGPWGTHAGQTTRTNAGQFGLVSVTDSLPAGHFGAFTLTIRVICSDGRTSQSYTAPVVMP